MPRPLICGKQPKLLGGCAECDDPAGDVAVCVPDPSCRAGMSEAVDGNPHRHAGGTAAARRPVGKAMATAKPGSRQIVVKERGASPAEFDDQLALGAAANIR